MDALAKFKLVATGAPTDGPEPSWADVERAAGLLFDPAHEVQLQALAGAGARKRCEWLQCRPTDLAGVRRFCLEHSGFSGVYFTVNPVAVGVAGPVKSSDIVRRRWLYLDFDRGDVVKAAILEGGQKNSDCSATDAEKVPLLDAAGACADHLTERGWPAPIVVDSGNGYHLYYRVDLPNDDASRVLLREALKGLKSRFDSEAVELDGAVHDAKRISKLPGTWARKGPLLPDRPYRLCQFVSVPERLEIVEPSLLADEAPGKRTWENGEAGEAAATDQPAGMTVRATNASPERAAAYVGRIVDLEIARVALAASQRNNTLNDAAFHIGMREHTGHFNPVEARSRLFDAACKAGLDRDPGCGVSGIRSTIESGYKAGVKAPKPLPPDLLEPGRNGTASHAEKPAAQSDWSVELDEQLQAVPPDSGTGSAGPTTPANRITIYTLAGLMAKEFPEPNWVVPGLLSEGLNILAGKPKQGKSMLALNLAITITAGGKALKDMPTNVGDVIYLSLEDKHRRVQTRAGMMMRGLELQANRRLQIATSWPRQHLGGMRMLRWWVKSVPKPTLAIIDVWGKFRPPSVAKGSAYEQDYDHLSEVKGLMDQAGCSALVLHHCRKGGSEDALEEISGTMGLSGAADGIVVLTRARNDNEAKIFVTGRDVPDAELALRFDPKTLTWESLGDAKSSGRSQLKTLILNAFKRTGGSSMFPGEMADVLEKDRSIVKTTMYRMAEEGILKRQGGKYSWPADELGGSEEDDS